MFCLILEARRSGSRSRFLPGRCRAFAYPYPATRSKTSPCGCLRQFQSCPDAGPQPGKRICQACERVSVWGPPRPHSSGYLAPEARGFAVRVARKLEELFAPRPAASDCKSPAPEPGRRSRGQGAHRELPNTSFDLRAAKRSGERSSPRLSLRENGRKSKRNTGRRRLPLEGVG